MRYKVQFAKGWAGTWIFDALNDMRAWQTARKYIEGHTQTIYVSIGEIWELDEAGNPIRKLDDYEEYFNLYKIYFENGDYLLKTYKEKDDFLVWNEAIRTADRIYHSKVNSIEQLDKTTNAHIRQLDSYAECKKKRAKPKQKKERIKNKEIKKEYAVYKVYFSDGECSGPYIAEVSENDVIALDLAKQKLKQHAEYNKLDIRKIRITKIEEMNDNDLFAVNRDRRDREEEKVNRYLLLRDV